MIVLLSDWGTGDWVMEVKEVEGLKEGIWIIMRRVEGIKLK